MRSVLVIAVCAAGLVQAAPRVPALNAPDAGGLAALNERFLAWLDELGPARAVEAAAIREAWTRTYRAEDPTGFIADSLAQLSPDFGTALAAFDLGDDAEAGRLFAGLRNDPNPYVAAHAAYFEARTLAARGMYEEVEGLLEELSPRLGDLARYCPLVPQLELLRGVSEARNLDFEAAQQRLTPLESQGPEAVRMIARQLRLEITRREQGTLGEVADVMDYVTERLHVVDRGERVQTRQQEIIDLLDKLIQEQEQQEQQQSGGGGGGQPSPGDPSQGGNNRPANPREESEAPPSGAAGPGDLHAAPRVNPGEMWGKLPPAERERILEAIRERYPSRYRQIVEQYYRSLAEEK